MPAMEICGCLRNVADGSVTECKEHARLRADLAAAQHDIERHVAICAEQAHEMEQLRGALRDCFGTSMTTDGDTIARVRQIAYRALTGGRK